MGRFCGVGAGIVTAGVTVACTAVLGCVFFNQDAEEPSEPQQAEEPEMVGPLVCVDPSAEMAGFWTDASSAGEAGFAIRGQSATGLLLAEDGTFWITAPESEWTIETGQWGSCDGQNAELAVEETIEGTGGGINDGEVLGVTCEAEDLLPVGRRQLTLESCGERPCITVDGTRLYRATWPPGLNVDEVRPICTRGH